MDKQIQKLKKLVDTYLHHPKDDIMASFGKPKKNSDDEVWFYSFYHLGVFRDEIAFIFQENQVADIMISEFFLWKLISNAYYYEGKKFDYKMTRYFGKTQYYNSENK